MPFRGGHRLDMYDKACHTCRSESYQGLKLAWERLGQERQARLHQKLPDQETGCGQAAGGMCPCPSAL